MSSVLDRVRIESAVQRYDFWLDFRGIRRGRRRELREELRANLRDAASHAGAGAALLGIGSPRALAHDVAEADGSGARWVVGAYLALAVFAGLTMLWLVTVLGFVDGVRASGVTGEEVSATVFPWGSRVTTEVPSDGSGLSAGASLPTVIWLAALLAFAVGARLWRLGRTLSPR